ncbi:hypothetical protein Q73_10140 [Bacillus coahuilensis m2-6]|uniref:L-aspartate oxidase n=1 Tax=Bacillus coahuilensis TaxID=408580 RepID=UPI0007504B56|nr:L-aspartate oxidase [Bacillus coahuilensis]KUP06948.1 hypothetical protein Q73_10140 [Bacillus coahuilensis m2-6]
MKHADILIIGSGIAALQLASHLSNDKHVIIITKSKLNDSNSYLAQGGVAAVVHPNDDLLSHVHDTLVAGEFHQGESTVYEFIKDGKRAIEDLIKAGAPFDRDENGELKLGMEGAHEYHRILHAGGDATGKHLVQYVQGKLGDHVTIVEEEMVYEVVRDKEGRCIGVKTKNAKGVITRYEAPHTVLATGGVGGIFETNSNQSTITGDGMVIAYLAGARLGDLEFIQYHPTLLTIGGKGVGLVSEAVRGEGATLINQWGQKLMKGVHVKEDLAPRHIVAHRIYQERQKGQEVFLDISSIRDFELRFPSIANMCKEYGVDLEKGLIPVAPGAHFTMGGVLTDHVGRTSVEGLYAIGEVACTGVHGANRLASNSLLEGLVYGKRLAQYLTFVGTENRLFDSPPSKMMETFPAISLGDLKKKCSHALGIIRNKEGLEEFQQELQLAYEFETGSLDGAAVADIKGYFTWILASLMTKSAILRTESRGGHIREDYPHPNQNLQGKRIVHECVNGEMKVYMDEYVKAKNFA